MAKFKETYLPTIGAKHARGVEDSIKVFERHMKPEIVRKALTTANMDDFKVLRQLDGGRKTEFLSPATVNKDLRNLRVLCNTAKRWRFITDEVDFKMLPESAHEPRFMTERQFRRVVKSVKFARHPKLDYCSTEDLWRGLLGFAVMTGWRLGQCLSLNWGNVDLDTGQIFSEAKKNKGRRDIRAELHPSLVKLLMPLYQDDPTAPVFPVTNRRGLYDDMHRMQEQSGVLPPYNDEDDYQPYFGFHDLRRSFATWNAENLDLFELQHLMQHRSLSTTRKYAAMSPKRRSVAATKIIAPDMDGEVESEGDEK